MNVPKMAVGLLASASILVSGCATSPGALGGNSADPMATVIFFSSSGKMSHQQYLMGQAATEVCNVQVDPQLSGNVEAMITSGVTYGVAYGVSGAARSLIYTGVDGGASAIDGTVSGFLGGAVNGLHSRAFARAGAMGNCTEIVLRDWENGKALPPGLIGKPDLQRLLEGFHATASYVRSRNRTDRPAPGLVTSGEIVGR